MNNELKTKDILEGVTFILMCIAIIGMVCVLYEVNELKGLMKGASNFRSITYRKQNMMYNRDKNKNKTNWRELMSKIDLSPIIAHIMAEHKKTDKNKMPDNCKIDPNVFIYTEFDTLCSFNRIQYSIVKKVC